MSESGELLAVDIGNTSLAAGHFVAGQWQSPRSHWRWRPRESPPWDQLPPGPLTWAVASVSREPCLSLQAAVANRRPDDRWRQLGSQEFPIETAVADKAAVGADRLAAAVAANAERAEGRAVIVVDAGSAITVDLIDERGVFQGGAIMPGMAMAAQALSQDADLLPSVEPAESPPDAVGRDTAGAIRSGLYWGAWGAIRELAAQYARHCPAPPQIVLTGGGVLWARLNQDVQRRPHLVLSGIALTMARLP